MEFRQKEHLFAVSLSDQPTLIAADPVTILITPSLPGQSTGKSVLGRFEWQLVLAARTTGP